jgi:hypothetical protein
MGITLHRWSSLPTAIFNIAEIVSEDLKQLPLTPRRTEAIASISLFNPNV